MTPDIERDVRDRFRLAQLPAAPESLTARVVAVASTGPRGRTPFLRRAERFLIPVAAVVVIGAAAMLGGGTSRPQPGPVPGDSGPPARLVVKPAVFEWCGPIGCAFHVLLRGEGQEWRGELEYAPLGELTFVAPNLPAELADGTYSVRAEIHVISDALEPGEVEGRDLGTMGTCESEFSVGPDTQVVEVTLGFWLGRCAVGAVVAADPAGLASLSLLPSIDGTCSAAPNACEYRLLLTGPGGTWASVVRTPNPPDQLVVSDLVSMLDPGMYRLEGSSHLMSEEPSPGAGHRQELGVATVCSTDFEIAADTNNVDATVSFVDETCSAEARPQVIGTEPPGVIAPVPTPDVPSYAVECFDPEPPALTCAEVVDAALGALGPDHPPIERFETLRLCDGICDPGARSVMVNVTFATPPGGTVEIVVHPGDDGPTVVFDDPAFPSTGPRIELWFSPPYGENPAAESMHSIGNVHLSHDRSVLTVDFWGNTCFERYEPWVGVVDGRLGVAIVTSPGEPLPSGAFCVGMAYAYRYRLQLPAPYAGTVVEDLSDGKLFDVR